jgi:hypothetical protein
MGLSGGGQENVVPEQHQNKKTRINPEEELDPVDTVNFFRLDPKALG